MDEDTAKYAGCLLKGNIGVGKSFSVSKNYYYLFNTNPFGRNVTFVGTPGLPPKFIVGHYFSLEL